MYEGLLSGRGPDLEVVGSEVAGRGVVTNSTIPKHSFVCEYKARVWLGKRSGKR